MIVVLGHTAILVGWLICALGGVIWIDRLLKQRRREREAFVSSTLPPAPSAVHREPLRAAPPGGHLLRGAGSAGEP